ncbi:MAG: head GIN domain-containing protein [Crocinitomicaceae bacterium]|nr:head GIN domain-containing protein [Crocinitomicaceae bacterium]
MTQNNLDQLFSSARIAPATTSVEEVTAWVGTAALATAGVLGIAAKLKLFIAKKSLFMLGSIVGVSGIVTLSVTMFGTNPTENQPNSNNVAAFTEEVQQEESTNEVVYILDQDDTLEVPALEAIAEPVSAAPNVIAFAPIEFAPFSVEIEVPEHSMHTVPEVEPVPDFGVAPVPTIRENDGERETIKGNGVIKTKDIDVKPFKKIEINGVFDVIVIQGTEEKVTIETDENLLDYIEVDVNGDVLTLDNDPNVTIKKYTKMKIYVTVNTLTHLFSNGVGDVTSENELTGKKFFAELTGVGDVDLNLNFSTLEMNNNGVGDLLLKGKANKVILENTGVGDIEAYGLIARYVELNHSGVGDSNIYAEDAVTIEMSGIGDVHYKGNPESKNINKSGLGSVKAK